MRWVKFTLFFLAIIFFFISCENRKVQSANSVTPAKTADTTARSSAGTPSTGRSADETKQFIVNTWILDNEGATATMKFTKNEKYIVKGMSDKPIEMKYTISDDGMILHITGNGVDEKTIINEITKDNLVITTSTGIKSTYVPHRN